MRSDARQQYSATRTGGDPRTAKAKVGASSAVVAANEARRGLRIGNDSANTVWLGLGNAAVVGSDVAIPAGGSWDGLVGRVVWTGSVTSIATVESNLTVTEVE